jgi:hypothetical protein
MSIFQPDAKAEKTSQELKEPEDSSRRDFLKMVAALGVLSSIGAVLEQTAKAQEGAPVDTDAIDEDIAKVAEALEDSPETFDNAEAIQWLICFNFLDGIVSLGRKRQPILGYAILRLFEATGLNAQVGMKDHHVEYPTVSLVSGTLLNMWLAQQSEEQKHLVHHTFEEAAVGTSMMTIAASLSNGIGVNERDHLTLIHEADELRVEKAKTSVHADDSEDEAATGKIEKIPAEIDTLITAMADVIQMAPFAATLTQFPLFAAGNAAVTRGKMNSALDLANEIGGLFVGCSIADLKETLEYHSPGDRGAAMAKSRQRSSFSKISNPVVSKLLADQLAGIKDSEKFSPEQAKAFAENYIREIGLGIMSGTIDLAQTVVGDVGPALAAPLQSVGVEETCKTAKAHLLFALLISVEETVALEKRMGVPVGTLINPTYAKAAGEFAMECLKNFGGYLLNLQGKGAVNYSLLSQLIGDISATMQAGLQGVTRLFRHGEESPVDRVLFDRATEEFQALRGVHNSLIHDAKSGEASLPLDAKARNAAMLLAGLNMDEEVEKVKGGSFAEGLQEIEASLRESSGTLTEKQAAFIQKLEELGKLFEGQENLKGRTLKEKMEKMKTLLHRKSGRLDLLDFEYWVEHLGPEISETAFVVFLQGIHLSGLIPKMSKAYGTLPKVKDRGTELVALTGSFATTAGLSTVADNWAATLTSIKLIPKEIYIPMFKEKYGLTDEEMPALSDVDPPLTQLLKVTVAIEKKLTAAGKPTETLYEEMGRAFSTTKSLSILAGVMGGGETTIGNSPHFAMLVGQLKDIITLGASVQDIFNHFGHHFTRFSSTLAYAVYATPMIEMHLCAADNPFLPANRGKYENLLAKEATAPAAH